MSKIFTITEGLENMGALRTGGQGSVYKGRRTGTIISAVKVLPTPIHTESADDKNYRNFLNEVEKLKKVNENPNPNVVKILNSGITESGSLPFIEMEFIEGPDLGDLLNPPHPKVFALKEAIKVADQLACALAHCHKLGVKHGDVKSNNIKFNIHSGNYVLLDFGLSIMSDEERRTSIRQAGAIEFMAPEQNEGRMLLQTDVYSYGVVLYELLAGQVPFPLQDSGETSRNAVMVAHMESPVPDLLSIRQQNLPKEWEDAHQREMRVPAWLINIVYKCLEKLPENRYHDGMELYEEITQKSISANIPEGNILLLKEENETLQKQLTQMQEVALIRKRNYITVPKTFSRIAAVATCILVIFSGYAIFTKKVVYITQVSNKPAYVPVLLRPYYPPARIATIHKTPLNDSVKNAAAIGATKKKHHRKKFLGIF